MKCSRAAVIEPGTTAAALLARFGITSPDEIDVMALAHLCGARTRFRRLTGCAALLVGRGSRAVNSVREGRPRTRQGCSIAHGLGHADARQGAGRTGLQAVGSGR